LLLAFPMVDHPPDKQSTSLAILIIDLSCGPPGGPSASSTIHVICHPYCQPSSWWTILIVGHSHHWPSLLWASPVLLGFWLLDVHHSGTRGHIPQCWPSEGPGLQCWPSALDPQHWLSKGPSLQCQPSKVPSPQCWPSKGPRSSMLAIWEPQLSTRPSKGSNPQCWPSDGPWSLTLAIQGPGLQCQPSKGPSPTSAIRRPWILNVGYPRVLVFSIGHPKYQSSTSAIQRPWVLNIGYLRVLVLNVSYPTALGPHHWLSECPGLQHRPLKGPGPWRWPSVGPGSSTLAIWGFWSWTLAMQGSPSNCGYPEGLVGSNFGCPQFQPYIFQWRGDGGRLEVSQMISNFKVEHAYIIQTLPVRGVIIDCQLL